MRMNPEKELVIYGCGGHARSIADVALANGNKQLHFVDKNARAGEKILGYAPSDTALANTACIIGIGDNKKRASLFESLQNQSIMLVSIIADNAHIGAEAMIEPGVFIGSGAHLGPETLVGANTIINSNAVVEHNCKIGKHCHISVNATIAGKCEIGDFVMVGAGATIIDNIRVCADVIIGAGAVVTQDITQPGTFVGIPARKI